MADWYEEKAKTPGQLAYEEDVRRKPLYHDGAPRHAWAALPETTRWSWERKPFPRNWPPPDTGTVTLPSHETGGGDGLLG